MSVRRRVLVTLSYDGDRAEVVREGDRTLLVGSRRHGGGPVLDEPARHRLARAGLDGGRSVVGGLLPAGAARAVVVDPDGEPIAATCGGGAWLALVGAGSGWEPPVRFEDDAGRPVRPPLPEDWRREPVTDATEPCPACAATAWERVTPADFSRGTHQHGGGPEEPSAVIVCTRCGHEEQEAVSYDAAPGAGPADPGVIERHRARRRREHGDVLARIDFTVYALVDGPEPELCGWGGGPRRIDRVTVRHRGDRSEEVEVNTARHGRGGPDEPVDRARREFLGRGPSFEEPWPELSPPALTLWLRARERAHVAALARVGSFELDVPVDRTPTRFVGFRDDGWWAIAADVDGGHVTITATGRPPEGIALRSLEAPVGEIRRAL